MSQRLAVLLVFFAPVMSSLPNSIDTIQCINLSALMSVSQLDGWLVTCRRNVFLSYHSGSLNKSASFSHFGHKNISPVTLKPALHSTTCAFIPSTSCLLAAGYTPCIPHLSLNGSRGQSLTFLFFCSSPSPTLLFRRHLEEPDNNRSTLTSWLTNA